MFALSEIIEANIAKSMREGNGWIMIEMPEKKSVQYKILNDYFEWKIRNGSEKHRRNDDQIEELFTWIEKACSSVITTLEGFHKWATGIDVSEIMVLIESIDHLEDIDGIGDAILEHVFEALEECELDDFDRAEEHTPQRLWTFPKYYAQVA